MKKLIYTLCLFTGMAISSCEDWLARDPLDQIADVNLTYTADECKLYVNQFYTSFWGSPNNYIYHIDRGSDNLLSDNYQDNKDLIEGLHQVPSSGEGWGTTEWGKIRSVNFLLDNCDKSPEPEKARKYIGEAYFFRAMLYYEQFLRKFGGAPWIDKTLDLESGELYGPRLKRHELADKILNDMDDAIDRLPTYSQQETGRVSKEAAMLYKARIALFEATWEKYHAGTPFAGEGNVQAYMEKRPEWRSWSLTASCLTWTTWAWKTAITHCSTVGTIQAARRLCYGRNLIAHWDFGTMITVIPDVMVPV